MTTTTLPRLTLTVEETATVLGISKRLVYDLCASGALRSVKAGSRVLIPKAAVEEYLGAPVEIGGERHAIH